MDACTEEVQDETVLAETVSFTDEEILVIMVVLIGLAAGVVAIALLGCLWAWRGGRGSQTALVLWLIVASLEGQTLFTAVPGILRGGGSPWLAAPLGALAVQVGLYLTARKRAGAGS